MNRFIAYNMPKIELHCHLDGSMSVELTKKLLADMGEEYTKEELQEALTAPMDCPSLADYLKRFDLPLRCLQTKNALRLIINNHNLYFVCIIYHIINNVSPFLYITLLLIYASLEYIEIIFTWHTNAHNSTSVSVIFCICIIIITMHDEIYLSLVCCI